MRTKKEIILDLCEGIRELRQRIKNTSEERDICLALLLSSLLSADPKTSADSSAREIYDSFLYSVPNADSREKLLLCRNIVNGETLGASELDETILAITGDTAAGSHGKIAYVRNRYNDEAFSFFSERMQHAKPVVTTSFSEICEELADNRCEFGILPLENTSDGKLFGFYSMLDSYELKIVDLCLVETEDSAKNICYGLVSRGITKSRISSLVKKNELCRFEFSVVSESADFCSDIISALGECGARLLKISSVPLPYDDRLQRFFFTAELRATHLYELALYLSMEFSSYAFIGFYQAEQN